MRYLFALPMTLALAMCGCETDVKTTPANPDVSVKVNDPPDLNPRTDHDIDIKAPGVDVDVKRNPGQLPDVKVDVK